MTYRPRVVDAELGLRLSASGAVLIEGPKACGKTETAQRIAASEVRLDVDESARQAALIDPALILPGEVPRLFDEWQVVPALWNVIRREVDTRGGKPGQFLLTGSAVPADDTSRHTGAGRFSRMLMRPMSSFEMGHSTGSVSLAGLLAGGAPKPDQATTDLHDLITQVCVGGWPASLSRTPAQAMMAVRDYLNEARRVDISRVDGTFRDPDRVLHLLRALARNTATYVSERSLAADAGGAEGALDARTVGSYLDALRRLFLVEDQPAWNVHLRSKSRLREMAKRHFVDPSLAVAALGATPERLLTDLEFFGFLFESMVVRDLRVYAQAVDGTVYQYRDNTGLEVDAIVELGNGRWAAFEIKLGIRQADAAAATLSKFAGRVDTDRCGEPTALIVVVGSGGFTYRRPDGVIVVPIGLLGP